MPALLNASFEIEDFLALEREKDLLRFSTAGSVDDGKSTLIGRLLYDTQSVYEDQVRSIEGKGTTAPGQIDFALLTDGLRAEREQGITIDVAYRYFSTGRRKFIIADTPGHEQYTRNMATGASTADATVVLIDASKGVLVQSRRHAYIASLLRVRHVLVAVNKMDLVGYDEGAFKAIERDFSALLREIASDTGNAVEARFVPVSALAGDNVVARSQSMGWYGGPTLLGMLEALPVAVDTRLAAFRFPVQRVVRPDSTFRGFAGQIASGTVRVGDRITVQPSGKGAEIARIVTFDGDLEAAHAPLSVTLVLDRELDISRGDLVAAAEAPAKIAKSVMAALVWMDARPLDTTRRYLLKHTSQTVPAYVGKVEYRTDIATLKREAAETLEMNGIGVVSLRLLRPIALDLYGENRGTGAFVLIDPETNGTVAAGMAIAAGGDTANSSGRVKAEERVARWGHRGGVLSLEGPEELVDHVERALFAAGVVAVRVESDDVSDAVLDAVVDTVTAGGLIALVATLNEGDALVAQAGDARIVLEAGDLDAAAVAVRELLVRVGIFKDSGKADGL